MGVARATTPTFVQTFSEAELDLTQARNVYVSFEQGKRVITKTGDALNVEAKKITVLLSQEETLGFCEGIIKIQANWITQNDKRYCSVVKSFNLTEQLLRQVIE